MRARAELQEVIRVVEALITQWRGYLDRLETGNQVVQERRPDGTWIDITERQIARIKADIADLEHTLKVRRTELARSR